MESICAFDIGIKNLSYCFLTKDNEINNLKHWELIDLRTSRKLCNANLKSGKYCNKVATYNHYTNHDLYFCNKHGLLYKKELKINIKKIEKNSQCTYNECNKFGDNEFLSKIYCKVHIKMITKQYLIDNKLLKIKIIGCMKEPLYDLGSHLYNELDNRTYILDAQKIVIENQPSMTNPTMKSISILLLSYFIMHKHPCVEFVAPSGKLKINDELTKNILSKCKKSIKYKITKKLGVIYCEKLLKLFQNTDEWLKKLSESKKKDDLADAFLHAYYHLYGAVGLSSKKFMDKISKQFQNEIICHTKKCKQKNDDKKKIIKLDI